MNNFKYAQYLCKELYDVETPDDLFEELGMLAYGMIGNHKVRLYRYSAEPENLSVKLPCNVYKIVGVTAGEEDWNRTTNYSDVEDINSHIAEQYAETAHDPASPRYLPGHFIDYQEINNVLYFTHPYNRVNILYKGELYDENGLPELTDKEAQAVAAFVAYTQKNKRALSMQSRDMFAVAGELKKEWLIKCDQARVPDYLNMNDIDKILDAKASWNRKVYGRSFKPNI